MYPLGRSAISDSMARYVKGLKCFKCMFSSSYDDGSWTKGEMEDGLVWQSPGKNAAGGLCGLLLSYQQHPDLWSLTRRIYRIVEKKKKNTYIVAMACIEMSLCPSTQL